MLRKLLAEADTGRIVVVAMVAATIAAVSASLAAVLGGTAGIVLAVVAVLATVVVGAGFGAWSVRRQSSPGGDD